MKLISFPDTDFQTRRRSPIGLMGVSDSTSSSMSMEPARKVVDYDDVVALRREMEGSRPTAEAVPTQDHDLHRLPTIVPEVQ